MLQSMIVTHYNLDSVDSTNNWAKRRAHSFAPDEFAVVTAAEQTAGRGRFERTWYSPREKNLYISYAFFLRAHTAFTYSQIAALAVYDMLQERMIAAQIKWPNDIVVDKKKIAGILTETLSVHEKTLVIVGIGININVTKSDLAQVNKPATSLLEETQKTWSIEEIQKSVTESFLQKLPQAGTQELTEKWLTATRWMVGTETQVRKDESVFKGIVETIEPDGSLILKTTDREIIIRSGEVF